MVNRVNKVTKRHMVNRVNNVTMLYIVNRVNKVTKRHMVNRVNNVTKRYGKSSKQNDQASHGKWAVNKFHSFWNSSSFNNEHQKENNMSNVVLTFLYAYISIHLMYVDARVRVILAFT